MNDIDTIMKQTGLHRHEVIAALKQIRETPGGARWSGGGTSQGWSSFRCNVCGGESTQSQGPCPYCGHMYGEVTQYR